MNIKCLVILLGLVVILASAAHSQQPVIDARLLTSVGNVELNGRLVAEVALRLASLAGTPVAVESLDDISLWGPDPDSTGKRIDLKVLPETSIASALDAAVAADPRYEWRFIGSWLHIMPKNRDQDYPLDSLFTGDLPTGTAIGSLLKQLMEPYLPADWSRQLLIKYHRTPAVILDGISVPKELTVREAIDIVLWRGGVKCWITRPVNDSANPNYACCLGTENSV